MERMDKVYEVYTFEFVCEFRYLQALNCASQIIFFSYFSTKPYVAGTQKNRLNETVPLGTQKTLKLIGRKYLQFYAQNVVYLKLYSTQCGNRGSYVSAHVLLILLNELGKEIKCEACRAYYLFFAMSLINSIKHEHEC